MIATCCHDGCDGEPIARMVVNVLSDDGSDQLNVPLCAPCMREFGWDGT